MVTVAVVVGVSQSPVSNVLWGHFHGNCSYGLGSVRWENNSFRLPCHEICQSQSMMAPDPNPELEERLDYLSINYRLRFVCRGAAHCRTDTQSTICTALWLISSHSHFFNGGSGGVTEHGQVPMKVASLPSARYVSRVTFYLCQANEKQIAYANIEASRQPAPVFVSRISSLCQ